MFKILRPRERGLGDQNHTKKPLPEGSGRGLGAKPGLGRSSEGPGRILQPLGEGSSGPCWAPLCSFDLFSKCFLACHFTRRSGIPFGRECICIEMDIHVIHSYMMDNVSHIETCTIVHLSLSSRWSLSNRQAIQPEQYTCSVPAYRNPGYVFVKIGNRCCNPRDVSSLYTLV